MNKTDISQNTLYLKNLINVLTTQLGNQKIIHVNGRHSDAFVFITTGSCTYTFTDENSQLTATEGDILYLAHNAVYTMDIHSESYCSIYCDFTFASDLPRKSAVYPMTTPTLAENLFRKLLKSSHNTTTAAFAECLSLLYQIYGVILSTANTQYMEHSTKEHIENARNYIDKNYKDASLSVTLLAANSNMSEVYFRKLFKSRYGTSPSQYITAVRLEKAKELMKYPFLTLNDCALQSGFSSLQYFCRVFKKESGISPARYRKTGD